MRDYFTELYGNAAAKARLGAAIENGTLPHAFLLIGPKGSGKKTLTREISAALNCERRGDSSATLPCHSCNSCKRIKDENFTDITKLSRIGSKATIGVEEIRQFREDMFLSPTESNYKIYVIDEADKLTPNAQNALLTVLEEPPRNVIIFLLADSADKILTTIKSRTQSIAMQRFEVEDLKNYVIKRSDSARAYSNADPQLLHGILMSADGCLGAALSMLSDKHAKENSEERALTERIIEALRPSSKYSTLFSAISELPTSRTEFIESLELAISALRDITLVKFDKEAPLLFYSSREKAIAASRDINTKRLLAIYEILKDALDDATKNVGTSAIIAQLGAKIRLI